MTQSQNDGNVLSILVSTDNHLGVWERDEWRANDSFESFDEVFQYAKRELCDFVLLGGDLFHENKPSRNTLYRCLKILNERCLGDEPILFQTRNDPSIIVGGVDNTKDPNLNVGLPIYTIHGNHDDPSGLNNLSAVDILSSIHYVNYFGKHRFDSDGSDSRGVGKLELSPVLLEKGSTKVALYGLGFMREERLARAFQIPGQIVWKRPPTDTHQWFNVFVMHQNRVQHYKTGPNNKARSVSEGFLPSWLDLVVWGHEHECRTASEPDAKHHFEVLQPGSTVATSLSELEAAPKHCFKLDICNEEFRVRALPIKTARPFKFLAVSLKDLGAQPGDHEQIEELLVGVVEDLLEEVQLEAAAAPTDMDTEPLGPETERKAPREPLIRVRVDYTGFSTIHSQRFGQRFAGRVANPEDILLWSKTADKRAPRDKKATPELAEMPNAMDDTQISELAAQFAGELQLLPATEFGEALMRFVDKDEKTALLDTYNGVLLAAQEASVKTLVEEMKADREDGMQVEDDAGSDAEVEKGSEQQIIEVVHATGQRLQVEANARAAAANPIDRSQATKALTQRQAAMPPSQPSAAARARDDDEPAPKRARGSTGKSAGRGGKGKTAKNAASNAASTQKSGGTLHAFLSQPSAARNAGAAAASRAAASKGASTSEAGAAEARRTAGGRGTTRRASTRKASTQARKNIAEAGLDSDDEDEAIDEEEHDSDRDFIDDDENDEPHRARHAGTPMQEDSIQDGDDDDEIMFLSHTQATGEVVEGSGAPAAPARGRQTKSSGARSRRR